METESAGCDGARARRATRPFGAALSFALLGISVLAGLVSSGATKGEPGVASISLFGTTAGGWSTSPGAETNPGPTLAVNLDDHVSMVLTGEDSPVRHVFWIDYGRDGTVDPDEPTSSPFDSSTPFDFHAGLAGTFPYYCALHSLPGSPDSPMRGTWITNRPPSVAVLAPAAGASWTGGVSHDVVFDLADDETPGNLTVWINYSYGGGATRGPVRGPVRGGPNPNVVSWTPLGIDASDVTIDVATTDSRGASGFRRSAPFEIDSTPPRVSSRSPMAGATGVPSNAQIGISWSEGMSRLASESAFTFARPTDGAQVLGAIEWSPDSW